MSCILILNYTVFISDLHWSTACTLILYHCYKSFWYRTIITTTYHWCSIRYSICMSEDIYVGTIGGAIGGILVLTFTIVTVVYISVKICHGRSIELPLVFQHILVVILLQLVVVVVVQYLLNHTYHQLLHLICHNLSPRHLCYSPLLPQSLRPLPRHIISIKCMLPTLRKNHQMLCPHTSLLPMT